MLDAIPLTELLEGVELVGNPSIPSLAIHKIVGNSKEVEPGSLFVAVTGLKIDGHNFLGEALKNGAVALLGEKNMDLPPYVPYLQLKDSRRALSRIAANFYRHPAQAMKMIGVTGTNGKTTVTYLIEWILKQAGIFSGVLGTINCRYLDQITPSNLTTPDPIFIHKILSDMHQQGIQVGVMEVSSHALDLYRVEDIPFDLCIFTNLTQEHLDYHKSMELYFESKKRLFKELLLKKGKGVRKGIVNVDDPYGRRLIDCVTKGIIDTYSLTPNPKWTYRVSQFSISLDGLTAQVETPFGPLPIASQLIGAFNLSNLVAAIVAAINLDIPFNTIREALLTFPGVPGRLQRIAHPRGVYVFVDYAHTPDALKNVLTAMHSLRCQKIITVFGCGGDRDSLKRPEMGREVAKFSDFAVITSDNPRTEDPLHIIDQIIPGVEAGGLVKGKSYLVEPNRRQAIAQALALAKSGDVVLIAGKGHEDYQIIGATKTHFDDSEVAKEFCL